MEERFFAALQHASPEKLMGVYILYLLAYKFPRGFKAYADRIMDWTERLVDQYINTQQYIVETLTELLSNQRAAEDTAKERHERLVERLRESKNARKG